MEEIGTKTERGRCQSGGEGQNAQRGPFEIEKGSGGGGKRARAKEGGGACMCVRACVNSILTTDLMNGSINR